MYYNKNRFLVLILVLILIFSLFTVYISSEGAPSVMAKAAALYIPDTESFIYEKNSYEKLPMASTTKIMTALIALEELPLYETVKTDPSEVGIEGSSLYLNAGEEISVIDLIYALLLQSANDAGVILANRAAGSIDNFAVMMNERAMAIGALNTSFKNPHGLDENEHYTTAHDLALISAEALKNNIFKEIVSTYKHEIVTSDTRRTVVNHNKLLKMYDGCIGVKTGYTKKSGRSLVTAAERDGLLLVAVTISDPNDWKDHMKLYDYGYSEYEMLTLAKAGEFKYTLPVLGSDKSEITALNREAFSMTVKKDGANYESHVRMARYAFAPVKKGDKLGEVVFTRNGDEIGRVSIIALEDANSKKKKPFFKLNSIKFKTEISNGSKTSKVFG